MPRQSIRYGVALLGGLLLGLPSPPAAGEPVRCSILPMARLPDSAGTYLLGRATRDTVEAGRGAVNPVERSGERRTAEAPRVHGQSIRVDRLGGADSALVARALAERGDSSVVVVPWSYDPGCRPALWSGSARWVPVGEPGVYRSLRLRPREDWAEGIPTFDAFFARMEPYPLGSALQRGIIPGTEGLRTGPKLTARQYYELYRSLPRTDLIRNDPDSAAAAVTAWERTHPELVEVAPAPSVLMHARVLVHMAFTRRDLDRIASPIAGTWRFAFSLGGGDERTFYGRTRPRPTSPWSTRPRGERPDLTRPPAPPEGHTLMVSGAPSPESLPDDCEGDRRMSAEGYMSVLDPPGPEAAARDEWIGQVELPLLTRQFPADSALAAFARDHFQHFYMGRPADAPLDPEGRFSRTSEGSIRFEQTTVLPDGRTLVIRGDRISPRTIACDW